MLLAIDIGNTETCGGLVQDGVLRSRFRIASEAGLTPEDALAVLAHELPECEPEASVIGSVVPALDEAWCEAIKEMAGAPPLFVDDTCRLPFRLDYSDTHEIGADRLADAAGVVATIGAPAIVVDFGTATTFDVIDDEGGPVYRGGAIAPGVKVSLESLFERAARLREVELGEPGPVIARSTADGLNAGWIYGYAGLVDRLVGRIIGELKRRPQVIATGGLAGLIVPHCSTVDGVDLDLTLKGLAYILEMNAGHEASA